MAEAFVDLLNRRAELLAELAKEPRTRHVLVDGVPDSKTTVYKGVSQLLEAGLLEECDGTIHPTLAGRVALERYERLAESATLPGLLAGLPADALDPVVFDDATVVAPDSRSFDRHLVYGERVLRDAERLEGLVCAVSEETLDIFRERVIAAGIEASLVLAADVADALAERDGLLEALAELPTVELHRTDGSLPYGLLVVSTAAGERVAVELFRDGAPSGLILNDDPASVDWARSTIDDRRARATPV